MKNHDRILTVIACGLVLSAVFSMAAETETSVNPYAKWKQVGPLKDESFFPVAVWSQAPQNARRYQDIGINLYVGLWGGPTAAQLAELKRVGMFTICDQNSTGLTDKNNDIIIGWMHGDEPDNAQLNKNTKQYDPPIEPRKIIDNYHRLVETDDSRPVLLNLSQGVAFDGYFGRGVRTGHPEDYPEYMKGCDIVSFDIYPATHNKVEVAGKLEFVARGVDRLRDWSKGRHIVWSCIECTRIDNINVKPTPDQVRSEVWMALVHGAQGLIYFSHQFKPEFIEAGLLADTEMAKAVGKINFQIKELAPVLNSPTLEGVVNATSSDAKVPVDIMVKQNQGQTYVFAVAMRNNPTAATFNCKQVKADKVEVIGEDRTLEINDGVFTDEFEPYAVHLYRLQ